MPLPIIADTYRTTFEWGFSASDLRANNVMHFRRSSGDENDVLTDIDTHIAAAMFGHTISSFRIWRVLCQKLDGTSAGVIFDTGGGAKYRGSGTGTDTIPAACAIVKLSTGLRGRTYRGRVYLPFVSEGVQADGYLASGTVASMQTAWDAFLTAMTTTSLTVASYALDEANDVTAVSVEQPLATQRRRQPRR